MVGELPSHRASSTSAHRIPIRNEHPALLAIEAYLIGIGILK
jgi:hypothetical protein